jgi:hypothetical protein
MTTTADITTTKGNTIAHRLQHLRTVALCIVILKQQLRNQQLAVMPVKLTEAVGLGACRKLHHHRQSAVGLLPHQAVNSHQRPAGFPLALKRRLG